MEPSTVRFLISPEGCAAVDEAARLVSEKTTILAGLSHFRKRFSPTDAAAIWQSAVLRCKAAAKLGEDAGLILLDQDGYEMSSGSIASAYHANLLQEAGGGHVLDLCAGIGMDTIAFVRAGMTVTAYEMDPARVLILNENLQRASVQQLVTVINADVVEAELPDADAVYFDPARRRDGRRWAKNGDDLLPPLSFIGTLKERGFTNIVAKLSPAIDRAIGGNYDGGLTFISIAGECKEVLLTIGQLFDARPTKALLLPQNIEFYSELPKKLSDRQSGYIWEPDAAIIRAGLTGELASILGGWQCDAHVDYFFTDSANVSPFATCYKVIREMDYSRKVLQDTLVDFGQVILKQRGFPQSIDEVRAKLKLRGKGEATVILTTLQGTNFAFVVERVRS